MNEELFVVINKIKDAQQNYISKVMGGGVHDFAEYRFCVGYLQSLDMCLDLCLTLARRNGG